MKKAALVLSGCGRGDGSEVTEAASCLIALSEARVQTECFAPLMEVASASHQKLVEVKSAPRQVFEEAARIARGHIEDLKKLNVRDFDVLVLPGGMGAASNLCGWSRKGAGAEVLPEVRAAIEAFYQAKKPIAACCIAPVLLGLVLGRSKITLTLGDCAEASTELQKTGAVHEICEVTDFITDREHKIVTTPAYMHSVATPFEVYTGIRKAIFEAVEMA